LLRRLFVYCLYFYTKNLDYDFFPKDEIKLRLWSVVSNSTDFFSKSYKSKITNPEPPKYKLNKATDNKICVIGSVDGVITAATIVQITITYFQAPNICSPVTIPNSPKTT